MSKENRSLSLFSRIFRRNKKIVQEQSDASVEVTLEDFKLAQVARKEGRFTHKLYSINPGFFVIESYPVYEPFAYVNIVEDPNGKLIYEIQEISLTPEEERIYREIREHLVWELKPIASLDVDVANEIRK
ncbi:MAG: protein kinase, partial [Desulfurococcaceae archaeon]